MKIELELAAGRRLVAELKAQSRIKQRVAQAAERQRLAACDCPMCVARRTGSVEGMLGAIFGARPDEPVPTGDTKH